MNYAKRYGQVNVSDTTLELPTNGGSVIWPVGPNAPGTRHAGGADWFDNTYAIDGDDDNAAEGDVTAGDAMLLPRGEYTGTLTTIWHPDNYFDMPETGIDPITVIIDQAEYDANMSHYAESEPWLYGNYFNPNIWREEPIRSNTTGQIVGHRTHVELVNDYREPKPFGVWGHMQADALDDPLPILTYSLLVWKTS